MSAWHFMSGGLGLLYLLFVSCAAAVEPDDVAQLLKKADSVKFSSHAEFATTMQALEKRSNALSSEQQDYFRYLKGWRSAYDGEYEAATLRLDAVIAQSKDVTLQFRARALMINVLGLARRYEEAFSRLGQLVDLLPRVLDKDAREQGLSVAALLYDQVGQYDLSLRYSQILIDESRGGSCNGGFLKLWALYESKRLRDGGSELQAGIDTCTQAGEILFANMIRTFAVKRDIDLGNFDDAIRLLKEHYEEVRRSRYPRLISDFDALLAEAYRRKGAPALARQFGFSAIESSVKNEFTEPLVTAYRLLYELAKEQGDIKSALAFHEQYAAADKGYLDDVSARHLAYFKVTHETIANKLQVAALNKQNRVLQLQKELGAEAAKNSRLYIALLITILVFIGLWAYKIKRSQLHFMSVSQLDGLTGICNRPHFISQTERALEYSRKARQELCLVLFDLDHFKAINDQHGHAMGDSVLRQTVSRCRTHLCANEVFGRFGGEEFSILLPASGPEAARQRAEQLRWAIAGITASSGGIDARVSASFGIAATGSSGYELRQLLAHADAALYQAKRAGRNRVVLYDARTAEDASVAVDRSTVIALDERLQLPPRSSASRQA